MRTHHFPALFNNINNLYLLYTEPFKLLKFAYLFSHCLFVFAVYSLVSRLLLQSLIISLITRVSLTDGLFMIN